MKLYNPFYCVRLLPGGVVNAVGLDNPGIAKWFCRFGHGASREKLPLIASVYFESWSQMLDVAAFLNVADLVGVEVNPRCPNVKLSPYWPCCEAIVRNCQEFKKVLRHPLLL